MLKGRVKINTTDLALLNKKLNRLKKFSKQGFSDELGYTAADIASVATDEVPVDTGHLKQTIGFGASKNQASVHALATYAAYVEFGTGSAVSTADAQALGIDSSMIKAMFKGEGKRKVNMNPQPYFFPAVRAGFYELLKRLKIKINKAIK